MGEQSKLDNDEMLKMARVIRAVCIASPGDFEPSDRRMT